MIIKANCLYALLFQQKRHIWSGITRMDFPIKNCLKNHCLQKFQTPNLFDKIYWSKNLGRQWWLDDSKFFLFLFTFFFHPLQKSNKKFGHFTKLKITERIQSNWSLKLLPSTIARHLAFFFVKLIGKWTLGDHGGWTTQDFFFIHLYFQFPSKYRCLEIVEGNRFLDIFK